MYMIKETVIEIAHSILYEVRIKGDPGRATKIITVLEGFNLWQKMEINEIYSMAKDNCVGWHRGLGR